MVGLDDEAQWPFNGSSQQKLLTLSFQLNHCSFHRFEILLAMEDDVSCSVHAEKRSLLRRTSGTGRGAERVREIGD